jgi:NitT/TauT family transport system substrate-binding protein
VRRAGQLRQAIAATVCVAAVACSGGTAEPRSDGASPRADRVRISTAPGALLALPQYVAEERGYFTEQHLDVTLVPLPTGPAAIQGLLAGDVGIMLNSPDFVLQANDRGRSVRYVVGNTTRSIITLIARSSWSTPNRGTYPAAVGDLRGARIGVAARGSLAENQLRVMLKEAGLDPDTDVTIVATGAVDTAVAALSGGRVDAWVGFEPGTTIVIDQLRVGVPILDLRKGQGPRRLVDYEANGYAAPTSYIEDHDRVVRRFVAAIAEAHAWMADPKNRAALEGVIARNTSIDEALISRLLDENLATFGATIPERNIDNAIALMKGLGLIHATPRFEDVVATDYVPAG